MDAPAKARQSCDARGRARLRAAPGRAAVYARKMHAQFIGECLLREAELARD
jgi:hypothetical protein